MGGGGNATQKREGWVKVLREGRRLFVVFFLPDLLLASGTPSNGPVFFSLCYCYCSHSNPSSSFHHVRYTYGYALDVYHPTSHSICI